VFILGSIDHIHITGLVYGYDGKVKQGNNLSKETFVNQSKEPASVEKVILYRPYVLTYGEELKNLAENETVVFSGFVQSTNGLRGNSVSLYEVSNDKKNNLLGTYVIDDPVSTQFSFKVKITPQLVKASTDSGNELQFKAYHGGVSSNAIIVNISANSDKASKYQPTFDPQKYNIPDKVTLSSTYAGKTSNSVAYLARYELADKSTGNDQVYVNPEDDVDKFDTGRDYNWNLTSGKSIVSPKFENGNPKPLFLDMFLKQFEYLETRDHGIDNESILVLYRFDSLKDDLFRFKTPSVREGVYTLDIKAFFDNGIRASYVLSKTGVWLS
jgi:hypothetical protein